MSVTLPDGTVITDDTSPTTGLKAGGHRTRFYPCLSAIATWAAQVQSWAAQAQAAASSGGGTIFPSVNSTNSGQSLLINSTGLAYVADAGAKGFRNKLINGALEVWQRGVTSTSTSLSYMADRIQHYSGNANKTWSRVTGFSGFQYAIRAARNVGSVDLAAIYPFGLSIPGEDSLYLAGDDVTFSFYARKGANFSAASSNLSVYIAYGTGSGNESILSGFTGQLTANSVQFALTTTATRYSITATIPSNATQIGVGSLFTPVGTAGAADYVEFTGLQLEEGSVATPFERRPYGLELSLCQRYYQALSLWVGSSTAKLSTIINMRATPTITGGGTGFDSTGTSAGALVCFQTTPALQSLTLSAEL